MTIESTHRAQCRAPCGRLVDDDHVEDSDGFGMIVRVDRYSCGCRYIRRDYHDGSIGERSIRHDGKVLPTELRPEQGS
ncbi:hypothetical protein [Nocardia sp. NPDC050175]|uniref:hypothetical protein n=1 Tax=Nocardia sp. NPDC050175 TaxID=3364317 RepID=UPI0037AFB43E